MASIEEKVEDYYKVKLKSLGVRYFGKTETISDPIANALKNAPSKSGNAGNNYPDIRLLLEDHYGRRIPVMIEAKGSKGKLEKQNKAGEIQGVTIRENDSKPNAKISYKKGDEDWSAIKNYAVNGALHYGRAILDGTDFEEVIIIGINGTQADTAGQLTDAECKAYYVSEKNNRVPKLIEKITAEDWSLLKQDNLGKLYEILDNLNLSEAEYEQLKSRTEASLESKIKKIHQDIYDNQDLKTALSTNEKLYLFCALIMAGLKTEGMKPLSPADLPGNTIENNHDGTRILQQIIAHLSAKNCTADKIKLITELIDAVLNRKVLWYPHNGESLLKTLFGRVKTDIIPLLENGLQLDFMGKIFNSLTDWASIENDKKNDVVLTPRYVTNLMAKMARTDMDSFVWDTAMGSGGFLGSALEIMIKDATDKISDQTELKEKIQNIKENQLLGIEILPNVYILATLNMMLMGDGSSHIISGDSHNYSFPDSFRPNVFLLNPPYSAPGKGFNFVEEALAKMTHGYACILIMDSAGNGQGLPYTKNILKKNTLEASVKMPGDLFIGSSSVSTCIFVFKIGRPHEADDMVTFIDFSEDGYSRQNRKKSDQSVNLRNTDHAIERYEEVLAHVLGKKPKTHYYTEANGKVIKDTISLEGNDWLFTQHQQINTIPTEEDFKRVVAEFLSFKVSQLMMNQRRNNGV